MNFRKLAILVFIIFVNSCGLKTRPREPSNSTLPSITDQYLKNFSSGKELKKKEKEVKNK